MGWHIYIYRKQERERERRQKIKRIEKEWKDTCKRDM